jgi:hypothetical protein
MSGPAADRWIVRTATLILIVVSLLLLLPISLVGVAYLEFTFRTNTNWGEMTARRLHIHEPIRRFLGDRRGWHGTRVPEMHIHEPVRRVLRSARF